MQNIVVRYFSRVGTALSVLLNVLLGGSSNQTLSARNYELKRSGEPNIVWVIDILFFWDKDHCMNSWLYWFLRKDVQHEMNKEKYDGEKRW
jgi:hypothetical protein